MIHFTLSEPGNSHQNEDVVMIRSHPHDAEVLLCALADGQGGQFGGGKAARVAVEETLRKAALHSPGKLCKGATWREITRAADATVCQEENAGYTTLIGFCVTHNFLCGASCGDSALLLINRKKHSWLTENQRKNPPVGSSGAIPVAFSVALRGDWKLLAMSDGVFKFIGLDEVAKIAQQQSGENLIQALHESVLQNNAGKLPDDFSIALFHNETP